MLQVGTGNQRFMDPELGPMTLAHCQLVVRDHPDLVLTVYRPLPGAGSEAAFAALAELEDEEPDTRG